MDQDKCDEKLDDGPKEEVNGDNICRLSSNIEVGCKVENESFCKNLKTSGQETILCVMENAKLEKKKQKKKKKNQIRDVYQRALSI